VDLNRASNFTGYNSTPAVTEGTEIDNAREARAYRNIPSSGLNHTWSQLKEIGTSSIDSAIS